MFAAAMSDSSISPSRSRLFPWARACAVAGFLAVALGAFGAHGLKDHLTATGTMDWWNKATHYHLAHAVVALVALQWTRRRLPVILFLAGILVFSGTLYTMAMTGQRWLGAITPIGGMLLLAGWLSLCFIRPASPRVD